MPTPKKIKSRKVIGGIILIIMATILATTKTMDATLFNAWSTFVALIYGTYVVGNVSQKYVEKPKIKDNAV